MANCPACDLVYHYNERPDVPRTVYTAFLGYDGTLDDALRSCSPIHLAERMPRIPYTLFHCEMDDMVNIDAHSVRFVEIMNAFGHQAELIRVPHRGHCDLNAEANICWNKAVLSAIDKNQI